VGHRHEGRHLFVPDLDELDLIGSLQRSDYTIDAISRISVDPSDPPGVQPFHDEIANFHEELPVVAVADDLSDNCWSPAVFQPRQRRI
jgi:hypothetical protein